MDNLFSSPDINLTKRKINCCQTMRQNRREMPQDLLIQNNRLKSWLEMTTAMVPRVH